jgi:glutamate N-acetyltransferase/amino-acid N-acetyltransferase
VPTYNGLRLLPLWESKPGTEPRQYCLDHGVVRLLLPEEQDAIEHREGTDQSPGSTSKSTKGKGRPIWKPKVNPAAVQFRRMERTAQRARNSLFPTRESVTEDYWEYAKFRFLQRMASSCITVFATQQMLAAIGMGASRRLPAAAAINWVLKDGLGRLGKLGVAANFGREFDSDVKRFRFTSSVVYDASSLIEMITPFFPKKFLLLATLANIGKSVGITTANVVRAPIQRSFVLEENLAEVAAKTSAQQVVADNLGLAVAVLATGLTGKVVNESARLIIPFVAFIPLATMDLYCIYRELKAVQLTTINKERAEIIADHWINHGSVPGTKYVSAAERLFGECIIVFSICAIGLTSCFFNSAGENGRIDAAAAHRG